MLRSEDLWFVLVKNMHLMRIQSLEVVDLYEARVLSSGRCEGLGRVSIADQTAANRFESCSKRTDRPGLRHKLTLLNYVKYYSDYEKIVKNRQYFKYGFERISVFSDLKITYNLDELS